MDLDQYVALTSLSTEAKVAHSTLKRAQRDYDTMLEELLAAGDQPITAEALRAALITLNRMHRAHVDTLMELLLHPGR